MGIAVKRGGVTQRSDDRDADRSRLGPSGWSPLENQEGNGDKKW